MEIGDAFLLSNRGIDAHLWIVISLPQHDPEHVVIVNLTTYTREKDPTCLLDVGDHPWITHATCVQYQDAKVVAESKLDSLVQGGQLKPWPPASDELVEKLLRGAANSDALPGKCLAILRSQSLVDD